MLFCSEKRLVPTNINLMTIESDDGMYYYVHRSLYDQAVILNDKYKGKENELCTMIGRYTGNVPECVEYFHIIVPEPLNILGYFLALVDNFETMTQDIEILCGVIHQMSMAINFRMMIGLPAEMRAQAKFSLSIETEFRLSWDRFFQEALPYEEDMYLNRGAVSVGSSSTPSTPSTGERSIEEILYGDDGSLPPVDWDALEKDILAGGSSTTTTEEKKEVEPVEKVEEEVDDGAALIADMI